MPRSRIDLYWRERIKVIAANSQKGPGPIAKLLQAEAERLGRYDTPSERTIARVMSEFRGSSESERDAYHYVYWPEVCERGELPWEASGAVMELLGYLTSKNRGRPTVSVARAFWRVTLASPESVIDARLGVALQLAAREVVPDFYDARLLEHSLLTPRTVGWLVMVSLPEGTDHSDVIAAIDAIMADGPLVKGPPLYPETPEQEGSKES